jgi:F-type H+-transporting ATPase subunit epsilon
MAEEKMFNLKIVCPERIFYEGKATKVELNTTEGEIGVYPDHMPMTMIIKPGVLTITDEDGAREAALHAGFIEILPSQITILAEVAEWPDEIDLDRAKRARERAEKRLAQKDSNLNLLRAESALARSLTRISLKG